MKPFIRDGHPPSVLAILDEYERVAITLSSLAKKLKAEAERAREVKAASQAMFQSQRDQQPKKGRRR